MISEASLGDFDEIMSLYLAATKAMNEKGIEQWFEGYYPPADQLRTDLLFGSCQVYKDEQGKIIAAVTLDDEGNPEYANLKWPFNCEMPLIVHRLAVLPEQQGKGLAKKMMAFAEAFAEENGFDGLRLDAYLGNPVALRLYESLGYTRAEGTLFYDRREFHFVGFEKKTG
jgi:GNAT superfamily N-acetyltransferase